MAANDGRAITLKRTMSFQFEATTPEQIPEISSFLARAFHAPLNSPNLNPSLLRWKYFEPGPEWTGARAYALWKDDSMVAHSAVWPIRIETCAGPVTALQALDWAASPDCPGSGAALMNKLRKLESVMITVGGSADTRRLLPAMGFKQRGVAHIYARVIRPWRQFRTRPFEGIRALPRLFRNILWRLDGLAMAGLWSSRLLAHPNTELPEQLWAHEVVTPESRHSTGFLEFMLRCPAAHFRYFELLHAGQPRGCFVTSRVGGQSRLADLRIESGTAKDWASAFAVATRAAALDPECCELMTCATSPVTISALEANRFRFRGDIPVFVFDPKGRLGDFEDLFLGMLDDDSAYLSYPESPYCT